MSTDEELLAKRRETLPTTYRHFYRDPVVVDHAEGVWIHDSHGRALLDVYNNIPVVGHSNPHVAAKVSAQLGIANTHTRYIYPTIAEYAGRLEALFPTGINRSIFTCSGSESIDLALQMARFATGAQGIIATSWAYHGTTTAAHAISPSLSMRFVDDTIALVDVPREAFPNGDPGADFAARVQQAIDELERRGVGFAGIVIDQALTSDGVYVDPAGFMAPVLETVRRAGGLFVADEVQSGFGRLGDAMWGFERHGIVPDMAVLGKPMGNGLPISALLGTSAILDAYGDECRYFNTFGGNPVCIAAADAVLDEIERMDLLAHAKALGDMMRSGLTEVLDNRGVEGQVRGAGLMTGVDLSASRDTVDSAREFTANVVNGMREREVLISSTGRDGTVLKVRPPLVFQEAHVQRLLEVLDETLVASSS